MPVMQRLLGGDLCCAEVSCSVVSDSRSSMDCRPPSSSIHGILQTVTLEQVAISYSRGSSNPGIETTSFASPVLAGRYFTTTTTAEASLNWMESRVVVACHISYLIRAVEDPLKPA